MNKSILKKVTTMFVIFSMLIGAISGCSKKTTTEEATPTEAASAETPAATEAPAATDEPTVIRWGTHWQPELDPNYQDPTTGEYTMPEAQRQAALAALQAAKDQLNVEVEFVQYSGDVRNDLLASVLAGNPICDIAVMWGGSEITILQQNILQQLDEYASEFSDPEYSWMFYDKIAGHNYLLTDKMKFLPVFSLNYNASMIEKVDSLKDADGNTIYPTDLFLDGKWTWSTFKDYLTKIQTYYASTKAPESCVYDTVQAYETDHRFAALSAMFAAGGSIYGADGLQANSDASKSGVKYIEDLMAAGVMKDCGLYDDYSPQWCQGSYDFTEGGTVFTEAADWLISGAASKAAERGESIGVVPWPRPDSMALEDPNYRQVWTVGGSLGILKGVDAEKTKKCVEFLKLYYNVFYKTLSGADSVQNYKSSSITTQAAAFGYDIFNETYGDDLAKTFEYLANHTTPNDYSDLLGYRGIWDNVVNNSLYGVNGYASYDVSIEADKDKFAAKAAEMESILSSGEIRDNMGPDVGRVSNIAVPVGTDPATIKFTDYFTAKDAIDGDLDMATATIDYSGVDFSKIGFYDHLVICTIADKSGNSGEKKADVYVYNPDNKTAPVITAVEGYRTLAVDEDASAVNWKDEFIASAVDADGLNVKDNITADITNLDTSTAGDYEVPITVTDYAGNTASLTLKVTVAKAE